jgi:ketosteroid isomerase-like protein
MPDEHTTPHSKIQIEQELRQMNDEWVKALVSRDADTLDRIMSDTFVFAYPLEGDDKAQFINDLVSGDLSVIHLNRGNVSVRIWGATAVLTGRDQTKWHYKGRELTGQYKIINVYSNQDDKWQLVAVQACPIT